MVLVTLAGKDMAPAAIVAIKPADDNMTEGAILAKVPFVCEPDRDLLSEIRTGQVLKVEADAGTRAVVE